MAKQVQLRRGTTLEHNAFTGAAGEITVDTTKDTIVVHNGTTVGGVPLARQSNVDLKAPSASPTFTGTVSGISKSMVELGSVDNTTDVAKPVSTLQESRIKQAEANALAFAIALG
jgi:hypothetical protein